MVLMSSLFYHYQFSKPIGIIENPNSYYDYIVGEWVQLLLYLFLTTRFNVRKKIFSRVRQYVGSNERVHIKSRHLGW